MAETIRVTQQANIVRVAEGNTVKVYHSGTVRVGWAEGTGTGMAQGSKIYIGPNSATPDNPQENDIWIVTA